MLIWAAFKNVMVARKQHLSAVWTHGEDRSLVESARDKHSSIGHFAGIAFCALIAGVPANWLSRTERLLRLHQRDLDLHLWTVLSFEMWCRRFLDLPLESPKAAA